MTRWLASAWLKTVAIAGGLLAAISFVGQESFLFWDALNPLSGWLPNSQPLALTVFLLCMALLGFSVWQTKASGRRRWYRRADIAQLVVLTVWLEYVCCALLGASLTFVVPCTLVSYLAAVGLFAELLVRLRLRGPAARPSTNPADPAHSQRPPAQPLGRTSQAPAWVRFFRSNPPSKPLGLFMALMIVMNLLFLALMGGGILAEARLWEELSSTRLEGALRGIFGSAAPALSLAALTHFCAFIVDSAARYEQANADKIRAERFKAELLANVSHDIRTPLTSIISYVDLMKTATGDPKEFAGYVEILDKKSARLKSLLDDLIDASKLTTGNIDTLMETVSLSEIVGQVAGEWDDIFLEHGLTLVLHQPDEPVFVETDSRHLWRVLENLFGNAAKYALPGTRVFAEIEPPGRGGPLFSLKNTSAEPIDLAPDALTEQFIRGDRSRHSEGNGLGLYIAKTLTEAVGASFSIRVSGDLFEAVVQFGA